MTQVEPAMPPPSADRDETLSGIYHDFVTMKFTKDLFGSYMVKHTRFWRISKNPPEPNYSKSAIDAVSAPTGPDDEP